MAHTVSSNSDMALNQVRKSNKPLMEKRRRARINSSLNQLKSLVLEAMKKDTSRYSKLEKADILEMTVKHLKTVQRQQMSVAMVTDSTVAGKYRAGFTECAKEVTRYLTSIDGIQNEARDRLLGYLSNCMHVVNSGTAAPSSGIYRPHVSDALTQPIQVQIPSATAVSALPGAQAQMHTGCTSGSPSAVFSPQETKLAGAFQLVPGTLSTGTVAFFVTPQQTATPVYVTPQMDKSVSTSTGTQYKIKAPSPMLGMEAPEFAMQHQSVHHSRTTSPSMLMIRSPVSPSSDDRKEPVWRPW